MQFGTSAITVYYGKPETEKRQLLRAEWSGVTGEDANRDIFQADGAAHPHWHVDGVRHYFDELQERLDQIVKHDNSAPEEVQEFGDEFKQSSAGAFNASSLAIPDKSELCWTGIHLAAHAMWAARPWPGPAGPHDMHAAGPGDLGPLRQWLASCVRYLQAQIQEQLLRGRW